jgi:hypothetical protein
MHVLYGITVCTGCVEARSGLPEAVYHRKGLIYQHTNASWYRSDKLWQENTRNREIRRDRLGRQVLVLTDDRGSVKGLVLEPRD